MKERATRAHPCFFQQAGSAKDLYNIRLRNVCVYMWFLVCLQMCMLQGAAGEYPVAGRQLGHRDNTKLSLNFCFTPVYSSPFFINNFLPNIEKKQHNKTKPSQKTRFSVWEFKPVPGGDCKYTTSYKARKLKRVGWRSFAPCTDLTWSLQLSMQNPCCWNTLLLLVWCD